MKAILVDENKNLVWSEVPDPVMGPEDALVEIHAAALNRADLLQRQGKYPSPPGCPDWMGLEISGIIKDISPKASEKSGWKIGDPVCALLGGGGYAEYANIKYDMLMPIPKGLSMAEAAALPEAFATSYLNLFMEGHLKAGQTAYIPAGASGLASVAIPLAKAFGARVITSVLSDEIADFIVNMGADVVFNSAKIRPAEILKKEAAEGNPVSVSMDCLGGKDLGECLSHMASGGYWILISTLAGIETDVSLRPLLTKGIHLLGSMLRNRSAEMKAQILAELVKNVWPKIEEGEIKPQIHKILPIQQAQKAHEILENSQNVGKVVLSIR